MIYLLDVWRVRGGKNWRWRLAKRRNAFASRETVAAGIVAYPSRAAACTNACEVTGLPVLSPRYMKGDLSLRFAEIGIRTSARLVGQR